MSDRLRSKSMDTLFDGIATLKTQEECYAFFEDLCTVSELRAMSQRFEVAKLLSENMTYSQIESLTGASAATISRVKTSLENGEDGYKLILKRILK